MYLQISYLQISIFLWILCPSLNTLFVRGGSIADLLPLLQRVPRHCVCRGFVGPGRLMPFSALGESPDTRPIAIAIEDESCWRAQVRVRDLQVEALDGRALVTPLPLFSSRFSRRGTWRNSFRRNVFRQI